MPSQAVVYGGAGALGKALVSSFKASSWSVISVDYRENEEADQNIVLDFAMDFEATGKHVETSLAGILNGAKVESIVNVAGGWAGGNLLSDDLYKNTALMISQSVNSSVIVAKLGALHLKEGGALIFFGASAATEGTPGMVAYGLAKAAVHHLVKSSASKGSGLPANAKSLALLPITLDTPMNRKFMPDADFSSWTPLTDLSGKIIAWSSGAEDVVSGTLFKVVTKDFKTEFVAV
ncbi:hypothetical protein HDU76_000589 [Blyttiomyces sp. JEL0837]|nr:hypothetical protein HDU76_000589 [Blyttiomyces sp. JEL0837]